MPDGCGLTGCRTNSGKSEDPCEAHYSEGSCVEGVRVPTMHGCPQKGRAAEGRTVMSLGILTSPKRSVLIVSSGSLGVDSSRSVPGDCRGAAGGPIPGIRDAESLATKRTLERCGKLTATLDESS